MQMDAVTDTRDREYTDRLAMLQYKGWKRWLDVQAPYRRHIRGLELGFVLEVGCGIGRNLLHLGGRGVGVDHNAHSVEQCRQMGLKAFTPDEFEASDYSSGAQFDSMLLAHVAEHMTRADAAALIGNYKQHVRAGGRVVVITPQEAGFKSDASHVEFMDNERVRSILSGCGLEPIAAYSFPFPRAIGRIFTYNEFVTIGRKR